MAHTTRKRSPGFFGRLLRSLISITILTALVLGITFTVKQLSTLNSEQLVSLSSPLLVKLGMDEAQVGQVAGALAKRISDVENVNSESVITGQEDVSGNQTQAPEFKVAIISDSEDDNEGLKIALDLAKEQNVSAIFYLGDLTSYGDTESLNEVKAILKSAEIPYYVIPGDHDLAASVGDGDVSGLTNFKNVFGNDFHSVTLNNRKFVLLNNSANYTKINPTLLGWFSNELHTADYVLLSQPLYHPTIKVVMGMVQGEEVAEVRAQAEEILVNIRNSNVKAIIAADQHNFSVNTDKIKPDLKHIVNGAVVSNEDGLRNPQSPRFSIIEIYPDDNFKVKEVVLR